jgi:hypothetical protein
MLILFLSFCLIKCFLFSSFNAKARERNKRSKTANARAKLTHLSEACVPLRRLQLAQLNLVVTNKTVRYLVDFRIAFFMSEIISIKIRSVMPEENKYIA